MVALYFFALGPQGVEAIVQPFHSIFFFHYKAFNAEHT